MNPDKLNIDTILSQIMILYVLIAIGFIAGKTGYLPKNSGQVVSKLVMRVTMPALILSKMLSADFSADNYLDGLKLIIIAIIFLLIIFVLTRPFTKLMKIPEKSKNIYSIQTLFGNVIFFAFPLFQALFGDIGVIYALFFNVGNDLLLWTLGVYLAGRHKGSNSGNLLKHIFNLNFIVFLAGIILICTGLNKELEGTILFETSNMIGSATNSLSMIFIGLVLANSKGFFNNFGKKMLTVVMSIQKQLIVPIIVGAILLFTVNMGWISEVVMMVAVMQLAMPIGTLTVSIAAEYDSDYEMAADGVFVSTLLSIFTLPLIAYLLQLVL